MEQQEPGTTELKKLLEQLVVWHPDVSVWLGEQRQLPSQDLPDGFSKMRRVVLVNSTSLVPPEGYAVSTEWWRLYAIRYAE